MTLNFNFVKRRVSSVLGLTLEGRRLEGVVLRRASGGFRVEQSFETSLSLDPLTNDPLLVGQEIRNRLDEAGVRESHCAVGVPLNWAMTFQIKLPEIPEEDVTSFLGIQAEKGFPYALEDLSLATSRFRSSPAEQYATLVAIPRNHLTRLEEVLVAARLKPISFSPGIVALQPPPAAGAEGVLTLLAGENNVDLQVTSGGGLVALRSLQGAIEVDGAGRQIDVDLLNREIRLTLGQIPQECSRKISKVRVFGRPPWRQALADAIAPIAKRLGLQTEVRSVTQVEGIGPLESAQENASPALVIAARCLMGGGRFRVPASEGQQMGGVDFPVFVAQSPLFECRRRRGGGFGRRRVSGAVRATFHFGKPVEQNRAEGGRVEGHRGQHSEVPRMVAGGTPQSGDPA